jgi:hypothetical protein
MILHCETFGIKAEHELKRQNASDKVLLFEEANEACMEPFSWVTVHHAAPHHLELITYHLTIPVPKNSQNTSGGHFQIPVSEVAWSSWKYFAQAE